MAGDHTHDQGHAVPTWWRGFDIVVWAAVAVIVCLGVEWLYGWILRERLTLAAEKAYLRSTPTIE